MARKDFTKRESKKPKKSEKRDPNPTPTFTSSQIEKVPKRRKKREAEA